MATFNAPATGSFSTTTVPTVGSTSFFAATVNTGNIILNATATAPDLQATTITLPTGLSEVGQSASISYTVQNASSISVSGTWYDALYLSPDGLLSDATLIGEVHKTGVAANGSCWDL